MSASLPPPPRPPPAIRQDPAAQPDTGGPAVSGPAGFHGPVSGPTSFRPESHGPAGFHGPQWSGLQVDQGPLRFDALHTLRLMGLQLHGADRRISALRPLYGARSVGQIAAKTPLVAQWRALTQSPHPPRPTPAEGGGDRQAGARARNPQTKRRRRDAAVSQTAVLHDATMPHDDTREGPLGKISFRSDAVKTKSRP